MMTKFQVYTDGRAAGADPVSGSDFVTKDYLTGSLPEQIWIRGTGSGSAVLSGSSATAAGRFAVAEGRLTIAEGEYSHAEGTNAQARGNYSHAEGTITDASGSFSHAEGERTMTRGASSHAEGRETITYNSWEHAQGQFNASASGQIFSIGAGHISNRRKNAISVITGSGTVPSASIYIYGIGSYVGTNPVPGTNDLASVIAKISASADLTGLFASASYSSNDKKIYFYDNTGTASGEVDATAFIKDGMLSTASIEDGYLVLTFNTDAGKEPISLSLAQIFEPSNYYTKDDVDVLLRNLPVGDTNVIEAITFNGTASAISNKTASITYDDSKKQDYFANVSESEGVALLSSPSGAIAIMQTGSEEWNYSTVGVSSEFVGINQNYFDESESVGRVTGRNYVPGRVAEALTYTADNISSQFYDYRGPGAAQFGGYAQSGSTRSTVKVEVQAGVQGEEPDYTSIGTGSVRFTVDRRLSLTVESGGIRVGADDGPHHYTPAADDESSDTGYVKGVAYPIDNYDAANKLYVDDISQSLAGDIYGATVWHRGSGQNSAILSGEGYYYDNSVIASGKGAIAVGYNARATGAYSHAEGVDVLASGYLSRAEGTGSVASGTGSHAEGWFTTANTYWAHAEGKTTTASGWASHAEGDHTFASGGEAHAEGDHTFAKGNHSHAEGNLTTASGVAAHAEGYTTFASGEYSHAEGYYVSTSNRAEHAQGKFNATASNQIFSIGVGNNSANRKNAISIITGSGNTSSASVYIYGIGTYRGTNPQPGVNDLATVISNISASSGGLTSESDPVYLADSASLKASASLAKTAIQPAATSSWATAATWVTANSSSALAVSPASVTASVNAAIGGITASHHTHSNKAVLDGITAAKTASWDEKVSNVQADWNATSGLAQILNKPTIPAAVTEETVAGWGFTKNTGTYSKPSGGIPATDLATGVVPVELDDSDNVLAGVRTTIKAIETSDGIYALGSNNAGGNEDCILATTDQIPTESTVAGWGFTKNTGTLTEESDPFFAAKSASLEASASLAKNLTAISASLIASGTLAKNVTAITASLVASASIAKTASSSAAAISAKTGSYDALVGLPTVTAADNGKILRVVNGAWALVDPVTVYSGQGAPDSALGQDGDIYLQS